MHQTKVTSGVTSTYAHDHRRPNLPKFFFEAVVWRSIGIGESITLSSNLGAMTFPARLDGPLGASYVVRNYPTEKRRFPLLEAGPIRTEPRMEPRYGSDHAAYQRFQNIQLGSCRRICP